MTGVAARSIVMAARRSASPWMQGTAPRHVADTPFAMAVDLAPATAGQGQCACPTRRAGVGCGRGSIAVCAISYAAQSSRRGGWWQQLRVRHATRRDLCASAPSWDHNPRSQNPYNRWLGVLSRVLSVGPAQSARRSSGRPSWPPERIRSGQHARESSIGSDTPVEHRRRAPTFFWMVGARIQYRGRALAQAPPRRTAPGCRLI
jgi:hypothetical protein